MAYEPTKVTVLEVDVRTKYTVTLADSSLDNGPSIYIEVYSPP